MTEPVEQWMCINFCVKLDYSSVETIRMIQKAAAMGLWWLAASSQERTCLCITSHAEFSGKTSNHPGDSVPLRSKFGTPWPLAFPKTKINFEREKISDFWWDSGKYDEAADGNWENCVRSQGAYYEGDWGGIVLCIMFLVSSIFFNKCLYFSYYMAGYLLDRPCINVVAIKDHANKSKWELYSWTKPTKSLWLRCGKHRGGKKNRNGNEEFKYVFEYTYLSLHTHINTHTYLRLWWEEGRFRKDLEHRWQT